MALALLLRLKRHLKIVYNLNDARCQVIGYDLFACLNKFVPRAAEQIFDTLDCMVQMIFP